MTACHIGHGWIHTQTRWTQAHTHSHACVSQCSRGRVSPDHRGSIWPAEHTHTEHWNTRVCLPPRTPRCLCFKKHHFSLRPLSSFPLISLQSLPRPFPISLCSELGHSGSTVYSNAAASREWKKGHGGEKTASEREKEKDREAEKKNPAKEQTGTYTLQTYFQNWLFSSESKSAFMTWWSTGSLVQGAHTDVHFYNHKSFTLFNTSCLIITSASSPSIFFNYRDIVLFFFCFK